MCCKDLVRSLRTDESGATAIEYALMAALIALGIIAGATDIGLELANIFNAIAAVLV